MRNYREETMKSRLEENLISKRDRLYNKIAKKYGINEEDLKHIRSGYECFEKIEKSVTSDLQNIAKVEGVEPTGLEYRLKGLDSLGRKVTIDAIDSRISVQEAFDNLKDVLRYTYQLLEKDFVKKYEEIQEKLKQAGYEVVRVKNSWQDGNVHKGINTHAKHKGVVVEIQYHTAQSLETKEINHEMYERYRGMSATEMNSIKGRIMKKVMMLRSKKIRNPKGVQTI